MNVNLHCFEREVKGIFLFARDFTLPNYFYTTVFSLLIFIDLYDDFRSPY